jgi:hypothetical protein
MEVKGLWSREAEIDRASASKSDASAKGYIGHATHAAGLGQALAENAEICVHEKGYAYRMLRFQTSEAVCVTGDPHCTQIGRAGN